MKDNTTYTTPSGLGGTFTVKIMKDVGGGRVQVRIHMPGNPDFHGHVYITARDSLRQD